MRVVLSIKPEYAFKIFDGSNQYEFRKAGIQTVIIYASSPVQKIIGEFEIEHIYSSSPQERWDSTKEYSGITEDFFFDYFKDREVAHAIEIKKAKRYKSPFDISRLDKSPPQSFLYLS